MRATTAQTRACSSLVICRLAVRLVHTLEEKQDQITVPQCIEVLRGQNTEHTRTNGRNRNPLFGAGRKLTPDLARLLFDKLLYRDALVEQKVHTYGVYFAYHLKVQLHRLLRTFRLIRHLAGKEQRRFFREPTYTNCHRGLSRYWSPQRRWDLETNFACQLVWKCANKWLTGRRNWT
jgi:superfamily II DNA helicase RecQ